ncbi:MAG: heme exporter protein CcmB [Chloroflexi bacterium]|nr:heme exporter protein CcmB [Chloroflexota bacterium]
MGYWQKTLAITWKDTLSEIRTREIVASVLVFTLLAIVIFNFAFGASQETLDSVAPGILWVVFAFSGILGLNRSFVPEKEQGCLEGLMVCPVSREAIYVGKMLGSLVFMLVVEAVALPMFAFLFNLPVLTLQIVTITVLTTIGFVAVGTIFSALAVNTRAREMVLPILFLPIVVPVIIAAVEASAMALSGEPWSALFTWLQVILAFDVIFLAASYLVFSFVIEE